MSVSGVNGADGSRIEPYNLTGRLFDVFTMASSLDRDRKRIIDVGSDHGHLASYAVMAGDFTSCVCTDIHKDPAQRSRDHLAECGLSDISEVYCTDGLTGITLLEGDTVVMAGLGGNNIMDIMDEVLGRTDEELLKTVLFVFQPQKTCEGLREYLYAKGFDIPDESVSAERGIYYPIEAAVYSGNKRKMTLKEKYFGPVLLRKESGGDLKIKEYYLRLVQRYRTWALGEPEVATLLKEEGL